MIPRDEGTLAAWLGDLAREGLGEWAWILDAPGAAGAGRPGEFTDEMGHRPPAAGGPLAHVLGLGPGGLGRGVEMACWRWSLGEGTCEDGGRAGPVEGINRVELRGMGPLVGELRAEGIEAWTQAELIALHGLSIGAWDNSAAWRRCESAARWLMAEVQPDNATNRPWAAHVFLRMWAREGDVDARMYAETLVSNCRVALGKVDRLSGLILASGRKVMVGRGA